MGERILFVDDDELILQTFRALLRRKFEVDVAVGPLEGLTALEAKGPFAVIVVDMSMPVMDGLQFIKLASGKSPGTVFMILSGTVNLAAMVDVDTRCLVHRFLEKPCPHTNLVEALRDALAAHAQAAHQLAR